MTSHEPTEPAPAPPSPSGHGTVISIRDLKAVCTTCSLRELCMPVGLTADELGQIDTLVRTRRRVRKGEALYDAGDELTGLFAVRVGFLKSTVATDDGREQVTGYRLPGDILGLDGVGSERYQSRATALEDSEVCVIPLDRIETLAHEVPALDRNLRRFLSREISHDQSLMLLLGSMRAEEKLAAFLLDLSERYRQRGYSSTRYVLRMTREEIGSYLGLKLETVSRLFSRLAKEGIIHVQGREVTLLDSAALRQLCSNRE